MNPAIIKLEEELEFAKQIILNQYCDVEISEFFKMVNIAPPKTPDQRREEFLEYFQKLQDKIKRLEKIDFGMKGKREWLDI